MAQARQQLSDQSQVDLRLSQIGLEPPTESVDLSGEGEEVQADSDAEETQESEEREGADASGDGEESEGESEEASADGDAEDEDEQDPLVAQLKSERDEAIQRERGWQGKFDRLQAQLDRLLSGAQQTSSDGDQLADLGDDDDVMTVKQFKQVLNGMTQRQAVANQQTAEDNKRTQYVASQPDFQDVIGYMNENGLFTEGSAFEDIPTDQVGLYFAARARKAEAAVKALEAKHEKELKAARADERKTVTKGPKKPAVPPTGGNGAPNGTRGFGQTLAPETPAQRQYLNGLRKLGFNAHIVSARR